MKYKIIPTIIANNQKEFNEILNKYSKYFKHFQLDIMDGKFVENRSNWPAIEKLDKRYTYEAHLMVDDPEEYIKNNYKNFDILIANFEKVKDPLKLIKFVKNKKKKIGFALNPETSIMFLIPYLKYLDRILLLTVYPGKYGAEFLPEILEKIKMLRMYYKKDIEVDGHMNPKYIKLCKKAGGNLFAVGNYLIKSDDIRKSSGELNYSLK